MRRYYLSQPVFENPVGQIDRDNGIIRGITIARTGNAKGHEGQIDKHFLLQVVEMANTRPQGIKARFGHPNMCSTALGTYLGRFHNYAFHGDRISADLHLDDTAKATPQGDLYSYVLDMAEKNPDMFGASLVFEAAEFETAELETDGKKTKQKLFRLKELRATDIVDDPAATDGLFSAEARWLSVAEAPAATTQFLDENPDLAEFIFSQPENLIEFLNNYLNNSTMNLSEKIKENFRKLFKLEVPEVPIPEPETAPLSVEVPIAEKVTEDQKSEIPKTFSQFAKLFPIEGLTESEEGSFSIEFEGTTNTLEKGDMLQIMLHAFQALTLELKNAENNIAQLNAKLSARPSVPKQVTDPQVSIGTPEPEKDETGRQMLQAIPSDLRYRLKNAQNPKPNS